ncbi:hypothetical protein TEA_002548 [Camellia sinensis var. sinensis]|uniref:C2 NT-type domain-containing protein n=1 Tax=Camellia sinensis var. sinensis TaxID=542762 RepID=A0A4S4DGV3_CAMSN|nr:hypothetical protein TEA_002548 [Camellia sinensis var. sinensis]
MVLGLRSKNRKGTSVHVDYIVNVQEIKPWPPSQSLRSVQSVLLQWDNGDQNSGSLSSVAGDCNIEFNESFALPVTLCREKKGRDNFQKNCLEFYLYESRKDKASKGQLLGSAIINLVDYGIIKENLAISALVNCKKSSKNAAPPVLYVSVQPFDKDSSNPSPNGSLSKEASLDKDVGEFVSALMNEDNDDESEIASFTDDDVSSHSSRTTSWSAFEANKGSHSQNKEVANSKGKIQENAQQSVTDNFVDKLAGKVASADALIQVRVNSDQVSFRDFQADGNDNRQAAIQSKNSQMEASTADEESARRDSAEITMVNNKLKHMKSVHLPYISGKANGFSGDDQNMEKAKEVDTQEHSATSSAVIEGNKPSNGVSESKFEWESRVEMLEEELREAAVIEAALYSVVSEHGSSTNKVHAPARRLSRFYLHVCKSMSQAKRASAASAAVSGLILVSKSCGNDVPRLTFWLSNSIMLRAIVNQAIGEMPLCDGPHTKTTVGGEGSSGRSSYKRDKFCSTGEGKNHPIQELEDWENPQTFIIALEKVETWIFSRIVESVWWQTLTPHMQSSAANGSGRGSSSRKSKHVLGDQEQGSFSIELWKKAFKDACERLCPIRAGGHECGCLPMLARLVNFFPQTALPDWVYPMVMEQLVDRLDVAMFNAILRESAEEMPTDPVSDPISDPKVLPILAGKSSFGAGAQLKNAIGNWSRWLSDLFGIEDNDNDDNNGMECVRSFKTFCLLNALSDLMMLPPEMLADSSTRKEVCPLFGSLLIKRVLGNFVPDEFSPNPIPAALLDALDAEDGQEDSGASVTTFPCVATRTVYSPPLAASLAGFIGEVGSQTLQRSSSSVLRKSYTSDDEVDELDSPITSIVTINSLVSPSSEKSNWMPKGGRNVVRYRLLREVWRDGE